MTASEKNSIPQDTFLVGIGASPGIAIGETFMLQHPRAVAIERPIPPAEVAGEIEAFMAAVRLARRQLEEVKAQVADRQLAEHLYIIDTHLLILEDQMLLGETTATIEREQINAQWALKKVLRRFREVFDSIEDEYLRERRSDIDSIGDRLLRNLMGEQQQSLAGIERKSIVVAHDLSPADTMQMDREKVIGFMTDVGGRTSHTAILGRSLGIPAVVGLETITAQVPGGLPVILDGSAGTVILNPSAATFREYLKKKQAYEYLEKELLAYRDLAGETADGVRVGLRCNIELVSEIPLAQAHGAEGIGLFRTEFLFMNRDFPPGEEEQFEAYRQIVERMAPHPVTIRTLDVGGDKFVPEINLVDEANPAMGLRGIRFSLHEVRLFKEQLRAILRASAFGRVKILLPMISGVDELRACRRYLQEVQAGLSTAGIPYDPQVPFGIMVETPSAAMIADLLAREAEFLSVGTNDLIQYFLAADRGNEHVAYLYQPLHPAILRALQAICRAAREAGIEVSMCGEMASDPLHTLILIGLGFDELSMNAPAIPWVKRIIRRVRRDEGQSLVAELLQLPTAEDITRRLEQEMNRRFPEIFGKTEI